ncbi:MAG: guanylate kinase [Ktedonobacterales bacterium]|nr:guanylate kinase [Ktedonobacterales bacterium]
MPEATPRRGHVFIISGPSGAGKDSVIERLHQLVTLDQVVTMTTRAPRVNEVPGVSYRFASVADFLAMRDAGDLLEFAEVYGNWYGVPADTMRASVAAGRDVLIKVDLQGARTIKRLLPDATFIFIRPASAEELAGRLRSRASETEAEVALRLQTAQSELAEQVWFDHVVENADGGLEAAVARVRAIITMTNQAQATS